MLLLGAVEKNWQQFELSSIQFSSRKFRMMRILCPTIIKCWVWCGAVLWRSPLHFILTRVLHQSSTVLQHPTSSYRPYMSWENSDFSFIGKIFGLTKKIIRPDRTNIISLKLVHCSGRYLKREQSLSRCIYLLNSTIRFMMMWRRRRWRMLKPQNDATYFDILRPRNRLGLYLANPIQSKSSY